jgi:hypothetical protein
MLAYQCRESSIYAVKNALLQQDGTADLDDVNGVNMFDFALLAGDWLK